MDLESPGTRKESRDTAPYGEELSHAEHALLSRAASRVVTPAGPAGATTRAMRYGLHLIGLLLVVVAARELRVI